jgi:hypothetical protein
VKKIAGAGTDIHQMGGRETLRFPQRPLPIYRRMLKNSRGQVLLALLEGPAEVRPINETLKGAKA